MTARGHDFDSEGNEIDSIHDLVDAMRPFLAGRDPTVMGAVLAELTSMFFAGHHPSVREEVMRQWIRLTRDLVKPNEKLILDAYGGKWPRNQ